MGGGSSIFTKQELEDYQELTYFTKKEIHHVFKRFQSLVLDDDDESDREVTKHTKLSRDDLFNLPELKVNPFKDRILRVFSSSNDDSMTFEDFLDMMSVFCDHAPLAIKVEYAFRIYDFDEDEAIGRGDLKQVIDRLTGEKTLGEADMDQLINSIMDEADLDNDDALSFAEFEHVMTKNPEFVTSFRIRM
ncbi:calcium and integrin-binding protein 1-like [Saccostrea echinata]|uniref:calcium and integrin-binding protein 1-like n=1 Tax=Saccostrea echinata TaxID=191078 RepID=UPI002A8242D9|nr:calcium and integrin-binding protein 1-like [Saccostrea echinata]